MRPAVHLMAAALLAGCGGANPDVAAEQNRGAEVTVALPPAEPAAEPAAAAPKTAEAPAAPAKQAEPPAPPAPAGPTQLVSASPPIAQASLARYIRGAGFACDDVVTTSQVEDEAGRRGVYKFDCAAGGAYRGTMKQGHLYFRPWTGG